MGQGLRAPCSRSRQASSRIWKGHRRPKNIHQMDRQVSKEIRETSCLWSLSISLADWCYVSPTQPASTCIVFFSIQMQECLDPLSLSLLCSFSALSKLYLRLTSVFQKHLHLLFLLSGQMASWQNSKFSLLFLRFFWINKYLVRNQELLFIRP